MNLITIYMVDDYLLARIAVKKYFNTCENIKIIGDFSSVATCLEGLKRAQPDIILMDIDLPDINGIEATKIIKEKYPRIKVIIFTSSEREEQILAALAAGACGYVLKSNHADLKKIIETVEEGVFWMDLKSAKAAFSILPSPNSRDLENLYEDKELKNILTQRELEVLKLMAQGKTNSQIASEIIVSTNTAKAHVGKILSKLAVRDRVQAVVKAMRANLL